MKSAFSTLNLKNNVKLILLHYKYCFKDIDQLFSQYSTEFLRRQNVATLDGNLTFEFFA